MLKALILPLIVPSLITAVGSLDLSLSGQSFLSLIDIHLDPDSRQGWVEGCCLLLRHHDPRRHPRHHPSDRHPPRGRGPGQGQSCLENI